MVGRGEWIPCFASLVQVAFALPHPMSSVTFTFPLLSPIPPGERE